MLKQKSHATVATLVGMVAIAYQNQGLNEESMIQMACLCVASGMIHAMRNGKEFSTDAIATMVVNSGKRVVNQATHYMVSPNMVVRARNKHHKTRK